MYFLPYFALCLHLILFCILLPFPPLCRIWVQSSWTGGCGRTRPFGAWRERYSTVTDFMTFILFSFLFLRLPHIADYRLSIYLCIYLSLYLFIYLSIHQFIYLSIYLFISPSIFHSKYSSFNARTHLYLHL